LDELCRLQPENPRHLLLRGSLLVRLDRWDEAEQAFHEACRLAPRRGAGYTALAQLYIRAGRKLDEAVALARQAVELEPAGRSYAVLGEALERSGDRDGARRALEQALKLEPDNIEYRRQVQTVSERP
jgi:cytochrome c-type biogenesis protein CcmH/NrfG